MPVFPLQEEHPEVNKGGSLYGMDVFQKSLEIPSILASYYGQAALGLTILFNWCFGLS